MKQNGIISYLGSGLSVLLASIQTSQPLQIIQLVLGLMCTTLTIAYTIYCWWKKSMADGKITKEEIDDGYKEITETIEKEKNKYTHIQ